MESSLLSSQCIEIIKGKLYWISDKQPPRDHPEDFSFNIDNQLVYKPIGKDFGPLNLAKTYKYVTELQSFLKSPLYSKRKLFHHTSLDEEKRANAACLMGCFQVLVLDKTAEEAWEPFSKLQPPLARFKSATSSNHKYKVSVLDVLRGLEYAVRLGWFDLKTFDAKEYEFYAQTENGNLNWIIPNKILGFSGPVNRNIPSNGPKRCTPEAVVPYFKEKGVNMVIRLNNKEYDTDRFTQHDIQHRDIYFMDGSCPKDSQIEKFLEICENEQGAIAVHCKAGLGRTGTMIACYIMKHYKFPAADLLGWMRLARPGSVLGLQQQFVVDKEEVLHRLSDNSPVFQSVSSLVKDIWARRESLLEKQFGKLQVSHPAKSPQEVKTAKYFDSNQVEKLSEMRAIRRG